jgi:flavin reductase (DIM6/NTAB) family NADH-FMN oxidoreductase RutF
MSRHRSWTCTLCSSPVLTRARFYVGRGVACRPVLFYEPDARISTMSTGGNVNLAPYSFFNAIGEGPAMLAFSSHGAKDSATFAGELREFVWNLATFELREAMNETSAPLPRGASEFERAGLEMAPSRLVAPPRVAASPCAMECKVVHQLQLHDIAGHPVEQYVVIGQVVGVHLDESHIAGSAVDTAALRPIARCGGPGDYTVVTEIFQMFRPQS